MGFTFYFTVFFQSQNKLEVNEQSVMVNISESSVNTAFHEHKLKHSATSGQIGIRPSAIGNIIKMASG